MGGDGRDEGERGTDRDRTIIVWQREIRDSARTCS